MTTTARRSTPPAAAALLGALVLFAGIPAQAQQTSDRTYDIVYRLQFDGASSDARARIELQRGADNMRRLRFRIDPRRQMDFEGDGEVATSDDDEVVWTPPREGGTLSYRVRIPHKRKSGAYDAYVADDWALFRADDVFPPATTRTLKGARSNATLVLDLPDGWSAVTQYRSDGDKLRYPFDTPGRRYDRPTGWMLVGKIGVRRARIAGTRVAIASPVGQSLRRMDIMAMLNWTLEGVRNVFPTMDARLVIVGADDPMWRGGLSGPGSLYLHSDRPLISENGTSTLLHELNHVAMGVTGAGHDDWLVEGLAEYYSVKLLHTSGSLSARRMELTLEHLAEWGDDVDDLFVRRANGQITARAATLLANLDALLAQNERSLDDVVAALIEDDRPYSYRALCIAARGVLGSPIAMLDPSKVPGAPADSECRVSN